MLNCFVSCSYNTLQFSEFKIIMFRVSITALIIIVFSSTYRVDFDASYAPLHDRVFSGNTNSAPSACTARPSTYKVWTHTNMSKAMKAVIEDRISIRAAAEMFSIPRSTLGE